jgi:hypothetical protein
MTAFNINSLVTAEQTLTYAETGVITQNGALVTDNSAVVMTNASNLTNAGLIMSGNVAVLAQTFAAYIQNSGHIGGQVKAFSFSAVTPGSKVLQNTGTIFGNDPTGEAITCASGGLRLTNSGTIEAADNAIYINTGNAAEVNSIINQGSILAHGMNAIITDEDQDRVFNSGLITGNISLGSGNDNLRNTGMIHGRILGGEGNDMIDTRDGTVDGAIIGGAGRDTMRGGLGEDAFTFFFTTDSGPGANNRDLITNFDRREDLIDLSAIDAKVAQNNDQAFVFRGTKAFSGLGQCRIRDLGADVIVELNTLGGKASEFSLYIKGVGSLNATDFIL